jgi:hypothetical protein
MRDLNDTLNNSSDDIFNVDYFDWEVVEDDEPTEADPCDWLFDTLD